MVNLLNSGGWLMLPLLFGSILSAAIIAERYWALRRSVVVPSNLVEQILQWHQQHALYQENIEWLQRSSPLGRMLAAGLLNRNHSRVVMRESLEEAGRHEVHEMER
ncbi:MAG TPA: MotA/TolQ/ExbB proton channel family protein, partial [Gammaproteobacteria bacterium]|nr:MotA/TolQ/ExbB proton channel family protein [Gammaproteobacteria bacterium]